LPQDAVISANKNANFPEVLRDRVYFSYTHIKLIWFPEITMYFISIVFVILLGWLIGCFINYVADVLPETRRFSPVVCPACQAPVSAADYLFLRACRSCGRRRNIRAWVVQMLTIGAFTWLWYNPPSRLGFWAGAILLTFFAVVVVIDVEHRLIMHPVSLVGAVLGAGIGLWLHGWQSTLIGGLAGFGMMLALYFFGFLFAKGIGRLRGEAIDEDALGFGDVNLSGVLGLLLGWPGITAGLIFAILLGGAGSLLVVIYMVLSKRYKIFQAIPYGPFLVAAAVFVLFFK
jgi:prepilin signal peptidase PulO-like enzyme (type II secretory pathway)